jgi:hypothetical protein
MPTYYFNLKNGDAGFVDTTGEDLAGDEEAREYARDVALELLQGCEMPRRHWVIEAVDERGNCVLSLAFVSVDPSLNHLDVDTRRVVEDSCRILRNCRETRFKSKLLSEKTRSMAGKRTGKLYLAAAFGHQL